MLSEICAEIRNYFTRDEDHYGGTFAVSNGTLPLDFLQTGQYFRVVGSVFNDGVWQHPATGMTDEEFNGEIWAMRVPPSLVALAEEIEEYANSDAAKPSPFASESFGGYSYTKTTNGTGNADNSWQSVFASRLNKWRRIHL